ncbi:hypothetical protein BGZ54_001099, partial [Gamsiella multidivaricata]
HLCGAEERKTRHKAQEERRAREREERRRRWQERIAAEKKAMKQSRLATNSQIKQAIPTGTSNPEQHSGEIQSQKQQELQRRKREKQRSRIKSNQQKELRRNYETFTDRQRHIYDRWHELWGQYVDPIEKVFNLGIPPKPKDKDEKTQGNSSPLNMEVPEPASTLRPGRVQPTPPCFATMLAFSKNLEQGNYSGGRFRLRHVIENTRVISRPPATAPLSVEEQKRPEYVELAERFESVFMWPMMLGMLHMGIAQRLAKPPPPTTQPSTSVPPAPSSPTPRSQSRLETRHPHAKQSALGLGSKAGGLSQHGSAMIDMEISSENTSSEDASSEDLSDDLSTDDPTSEDYSSDDSATGDMTSRRLRPNDLAVEDLSSDNSSSDDLSSRDLSLDLFSEESTSEDDWIPTSKRRRVSTSSH